MFATAPGVLPLRSSSMAPRCWSVSAPFCAAEGSSPLRRSAALGNSGEFWGIDDVADGGDEDSDDDDSTCGSSDSTDMMSTPSSARGMPLCVIFTCMCAHRRREPGSQKENPRAGGETPRGSPG